MPRLHNALTRRDCFRLAAAGVVGWSFSGWLGRLAADVAKNPERRRSCILLWMNGGPSQLDTFDPKPEHENGGPFKAIQSSVPGIQISEHLPKIAKLMDHMAVVRSMSTKEADHSRASYLMRTGYAPGGVIQYPSIGSLVAKELGPPDAELPSFVSVAPYRLFSPAAYGPGFLGPLYAPLVVGDTTQLAFRRPGGQENYDDALKVQDLARAKEVSEAQGDARIELLMEMEEAFLANRPDAPLHSHRAAYERAVRLMRSAAAKAFDLEEEPANVRDAYGRSLFGQGCLLARRLVERNVPFVEVTLGGLAGNQALGWDTHANNFTGVKQLSEVLDPAWATLMTDLKERGLLDSTLIVWMGEFGRTPKINPAKGRDHFATAWSTVLAGGGIRGGQVIGSTSEDGLAVKDRPVSVPDLLATVCTALGVSVKKQNLSNVGRPIRVVDPEGKPIKEALA
jgi:uncharacterized protein (DUF1501 family)